MIKFKIELLISISYNIYYFLFFIYYSKLKSDIYQSYLIYKTIILKQNFKIVFIYS